MKRLLILCGGQSPEHAISIRSCRNILASLDRSKYEITLFGITKEGKWRHIEEHNLTDEITDLGIPVTIHPGKTDCFWGEDSLGKFDVAFPVLHGPNGEDGTIQGMLKLLKIPFVGPDVLSSSVSMDKEVTKRLLAEAGQKIAPYVLIRDGESIPDFKEVSAKLGEVVFIKPANMGSSVGVHRVTKESEWQQAIKDAMLYDSKVLVEQLISGRELECAVLGNEAPKTSGVGEVLSGDFYSYDEKYSSASEAQTKIPADVDEEVLTELKETALLAYQTLNCEGMARVDMFLTDSGEIYINEVNTIPGFTSISMYPKLWEEEGLNYSDLLDQLLELAMARASRS